MNQNERRKRASGCDGKLKHPTLLAVQYHIESNDKVGIEDYYLCKFCDNYHTYTMPGRKKLSNKKTIRASQKLSHKGPKKMKLHNKCRRHSNNRKRNH